MKASSRTKESAGKNGRSKRTSAELSSVEDHQQQQAKPSEAVHLQADRSQSAGSASEEKENETPRKVFRTSLENAPATGPKNKANAAANPSFQNRFGPGLLSSFLSNATRPPTFPSSIANSTASQTASAENEAGKHAHAVQMSASAENLPAIPVAQVLESSAPEKKAHGASTSEQKRKENMNEECVEDMMSDFCKFTDRVKTINAAYSMRYRSLYQRLQSETEAFERVLQQQEKTNHELQSQIQYLRQVTQRLFAIFDSN
eukprot:ANDGO_02072.mRNA.1 hypothetical protein